MVHTTRAREVVLRSHMNSATQHGKLWAQGGWGCRSFSDDHSHIVHRLLSRTLSRTRSLVTVSRLGIRMTTLKKYGYNHCSLTDNNTISLLLSSRHFLLSCQLPTQCPAPGDTLPWVAHKLTWCVCTLSLRYQLHGGEKLEGGQGGRWVGGVCGVWKDKYCNRSIH